MHSKIRMMLVNGLSDSRLKSGKPYETITFAQIARMAASPTAVTKRDAKGFIPSTYNAHDARSHKAQRLYGKFHAIVCDIDNGTHKLSEVSASVTEVVGGVARVIYSTSSAKADTPKWRVIIPMAQPVFGVGFEFLQTAFFNALGTVGIACDRAMKGAAQVSLLPNVPPELRSPVGEPLFYDYLVGGGSGLSTPPAALIEHATRLAMQVAEAEIAAKKASAARAAERERLRDQTGMLSPIEQFNADHDLEDILIQNGWLPRGPHWFASPFSKSKGTSVHVFDQRAVSFTSSDVGQIGRQTANGWTTYDAWDVFVTFDHGGNEKAALEDYCERSGYNQVRLHNIISTWGKK